MLRTDALDYDLPPNLIATHPARPRDSARLMVLPRAGGPPTHRSVRDLPDLLRPGDLLILNSTRVLPARFRGQRADTTGAADGLYLGPVARAFQPVSAAADPSLPAAPNIAPQHELDSPSRPPLWSILLKTRRAKPGVNIQLFDRAGNPTNLSLRILQKHSDDPSSTDSGGWTAELFGSHDPAPTILDRIGLTPLPPYIRQARKHTRDEDDDATDRADYQTTFADAPIPLRACGGGGRVKRGGEAGGGPDAVDSPASHEQPTGSIAAPTAGLHFTPDLLSRLDSRGINTAHVTLHVGMGTFKPVESEFVEQHPIHAEWCHIPPETWDAISRTRQDGGRIIAVGTTSARTLESFPTESSDPAWTRLLITPGHTWNWIDGLLTNFHLPRSTLLALVAARLGDDGAAVTRLLDAYREAIDQKYRFYSFGDAMLVT